MPYADTVPPENIKSLRPFFDQLQDTSTQLDDMLAELDLSKEETERLINSQKFATHRKLRAQLIQQQLQIAAQNHARQALETLANLTDSSNAAIARLAATQILHYAGIAPPRPVSPEKTPPQNETKAAVFNGGADVPAKVPASHTIQLPLTQNETENQKRKIKNPPKPTDSIGGGPQTNQPPTGDARTESHRAPCETENQNWKIKNRLWRFLTAFALTTLLAKPLLMLSTQSSAVSTQPCTGMPTAPSENLEREADWGIVARGGRMGSSPTVRSGPRRSGAAAWLGLSFRGGVMMNEATVLEALGELRNRVRGVKIFEGNVSVQVADVGGARPKWELRKKIDEALAHVEGVEEVFVDFVAGAGEESPAGRGGQAGGGGQGKPAGHSHGHEHGAGHGGGKPSARGIPGVKYVIAVGAGKGGVGKSTVAVNLAVGLLRLGKKVAILDGDIYGPSIPTLTAIAPRPPRIEGERIIPFTLSDPADAKVSLNVMSMGFMVEPEKALIWRGPMAHSAMKQMIEQVEWTHVPEGEGASGKGDEETGGLDYLIVDLPPGTGDVSLTLAQTVPLTGAVIVATPQEVALADARRAVRMFQQLGVEILGVIENMSYFICEHGTEYDIFGRGGAQVMAQQMGLPFLGDLPIEVGLRKNSDAGRPFDNFGAESRSRGPLLALADMLEKQVAVRMATRPAAKPLNLRIS